MIDIIIIEMPVQGEFALLDPRCQKGNDDASDQPRGTRIAFPAKRVKMQNQNRNHGGRVIIDDIFKVVVIDHPNGIDEELQCRRSHQDFF